ncbi:MAG: glycosyltransferase family 1 protein [Sandaracinaceae bacterium]
MMRTLALYVPHFDRQPAGLGTYVREMGRRIIERADDVLLYTETPDFVPTSWDRSKLSIRPIPTGRIAAPLARTVARQLWLNTVLPLELRRRKVGALLVPYHDGMIRPSVPQVSVVHDLTPLVVPSQYFHPLLAAHLRWVLPRILSRSTTVAVSQSTKSDLARLLGLDEQDIQVVGEGYDRDVFRPRTPDELEEAFRATGVRPPYLMYSGTYAAHKNTLMLLDILRGSLDRGLELKLVLCGRPDAGDFAPMREAIERLDLAEHVVTPGYLPRDHLAALMAGATAFVFPSLYEGFGLAPLEAMACGAVVLCSDRASLPEVVGDGGVLLSPSTSTPWVDALEEVGSDPTLESALRARAVARAVEFDWDLSATDLWDALIQSSV